MSGGSPTDRLADGFVASDMPPVAPDGGLQLEPAPTSELPHHPISLCELGPCAKFHLLASELDAQKPLDGSRMRLPVIQTRTCYPSPGSEIELGDTSVRDCNLWEPLNSSQRYVRDEKRELFRTMNPETYALYEKSWQGALEGDAADGDQ